MNIPHFHENNLCWTEMSKEYFIFIFYFYIIYFFLSLDYLRRHFLWNFPRECDIIENLSRNTVLRLKSMIKERHGSEKAKFEIESSTNCSRISINLFQHILHKKNHDIFAENKFCDIIIKVIILWYNKFLYMYIICNLYVRKIVIYDCLNI